MKKIIQIGGEILIAIALLAFTFLTPNITVQADGGIWSDGTNTYATLQAAVDANLNGATITLSADTDQEPGFALLANGSSATYVIDLGGHSVQFKAGTLVGSTGTASQNIHLEKGYTVTIKNGSLKASTDARMLIQNYADLTLTDLNIDFSTSTSAKNDDVAVSLNNGKVVINGSTSITTRESSSQDAFDVCWWPSSYPDGVQVTVDTTGTINGIVLFDTAGAIPSDSTVSSSNLTINNGTFAKDFEVEDKPAFKSNGQMAAGVIKVNGGSFQPTETMKMILLTSSQDVAEGYEAVLENGSYVIRAKQTATAASESTPTYDKRDKNQDGVVTCDEAYGEGWTWDDATNACVYNAPASVQAVTTTSSDANLVPATGVKG